MLLWTMIVISEKTCYIIFRMNLSMILCIVKYNNIMSVLLSLYTAISSAWYSVYICSVPLFSGYSYFFQLYTTLLVFCMYWTVEVHIYNIYTYEFSLSLHGVVFSTRPLATLYVALIFYIDSQLYIYMINMRLHVMLYIYHVQKWRRVI